MLRRNLLSVLILSASTLSVNAAKDKSLNDTLEFSKGTSLDFAALIQQALNRMEEGQKSGKSKEQITEELKAEIARDSAESFHRSTQAFLKQREKEKKRLAEQKKARDSAKKFFNESVEVKNNADIKKINENAEKIIKKTEDEHQKKMRQLDREHQRKMLLIEQRDKEVTENEEGKRKEMGIKFKKELKRKKRRRFEQ